MTRQELNREARLITALACDLTHHSDQALAVVTQDVYRGLAPAGPRRDDASARRTVLAAACEAARRVGQRIVEGYHEDLRVQLTRYLDMPEGQYRHMRALRMRVLAGGRPEPSAESLLPELFSRCAARCGRAMAELIERQVWLRTVDRAWSTHLETVNAIREGVHLAAFGGMNPLDVFHEQVAASHEAMWRDIADGMREGFRQAVAEDGSATGSYGPPVPAATRTHLMAETPEAFSRLPHLVKGAAAAVSAPMLALLAWYDRRQAAKRRRGGRGADRN